jgi:hypothetical protein
MLSRDRVTIDGVGLVTGFIEHVYTRHITPSNYNSLTGLVTVTTAHKVFCVFISRFMVTEPNSVLC